MTRMRNRIMKYALQNAIFYGGKANPKSVLGRVLGSEPDLRANPSQVRVEVDKAVSDVNRLTQDIQEARLRELAPEMLVREEKKQEELPPLPNAEIGKVVTRFAPSPTGPLNIAHLLRAAMLSYLYARKYQGRFILRLEDTDPGKVERRFYQAIQDDLETAGIEWDRLLIQSDHMSLYYRHARTLLSRGRAYMCTCPPESFRKLKLQRRNCPCRDKSPKASLADFQNALRGVYGEGQIAMRLKTSMRDPNPALRDPPIMRVSRARHPLKGRKFNMWPLYNYSCAIDDHELGVTHVFRGKEHEHNTEVQRRIYRALGWQGPTTVNFGMIYLPGEKLHTRDIREMISSGRVTGWDDPRLHTVRALVRRGFQSQAFRLYAIQVGLTKSDIRLNWDNLESFNRSIIDPEANRFMLVIDPVKLTLRDGPDRPRVMADLHPDYPKRGKKAMPLDRGAVYISREDWKAFRGKTVRLKSLFNVRLQERTARYAGGELVQGMPKIQWVSRPNVEVRLLMPDRKLHALGEQALRTLKKGQLLQMERIGYGRVDKKAKEMAIIWTHR
jgi:glutamyl-tRNA synthetase